MAEPILDYEFKRDCECSPPFVAQAGEEWTCRHCGTTYEFDGTEWGSTGQWEEYQPSELELDSILKRKPNGGLE